MIDIRITFCEGFKLPLGVIQMINKFISADTLLFTLESEEVDMLLSELNDCELNYIYQIL